MYQTKLTLKSHQSLLNGNIGCDWNMNLVDNMETWGLTNHLKMMSLFFFCCSGRFLKVLKIPMSEVTDNMVEKHAVSLANMTVLDISYCLKITCKGLEAFGKNCKALVHLRRNMPPPELVPTYNVKPDVSEALTIADTMPGLQHLELGYGRFTDVGLEAIFAKCKALTHLDIQGCWSVKLLDSHLEDRCLQLQ